MRSVAKWVEPISENIRVISLDVTSVDSINKGIQQIREEDGKIDILVNNAGYGIAGTVEQVDVDDAKALFDVNVWGPVRLLQAVLPLMRKHKSGHIINISSTSGIRGIPCFEFYTGSKFALEGIMESMRYSLAAFNISVTNINAGPVRTSFTDRFGNSELGGKGTLSVDDETGYLEALTNRMVLGLNKRMESPEAQTSENIAQLIVNVSNLRYIFFTIVLHSTLLYLPEKVIHLSHYQRVCNFCRLTAKRMSDVPFNVGSSYDSQKVLEEVRVHPTGWGGIYSTIFRSLPPLPPVRPAEQEL